MLTDIFAYRYLDQPIWEDYTETEQRLLNQIFGIAKDALPYYLDDGKEDERNKANWKTLHDRLARELGVDELSQRYYSYTQKTISGQDHLVSGYFSWEYVCSQFVNAKYTGQFNADKFIKERISFIELALKLRGEEVALINANSLVEENNAAFLDTIALPSGIRSDLRVPGSAVSGLRARNESMNLVFQNQVLELNERFRRAKVPLTYHNGFIQFATDQLIEQNIAKPFWDLISKPLWKNVDIDMKEALDHRDSNGKDPALFAAKALESTVKIVSDAKQWTRGTEIGISHYVDNLTSRANGSFLTSWEGEMLKDYFGKVRNPLGHGPGSKPMPELTLAQTDWAIETAMSWIRMLVRRM